eukprot:3638131-Pyramimonas_sp.AAC.1
MANRGAGRPSRRSWASAKLRSQRVVRTKGSTVASVRAEWQVDKAHVQPMGAPQKQGQTASSAATGSQMPTPSTTSCISVIPASSAAIWQSVDAEPVAHHLEA